MKKLSGGSKRRGLQSLFVLAVAIAGLFMIFRLFGADEQQTLNTLQKLDSGWYRMEDGGPVPVSEDEAIPFGEDGSVTVYRPVSSAGTITTRAALYRVRMYLDDVEIYCFDDSAFPCNDQMRSKIHCDAGLRNLTSGSVLSITYFQNGPAELEMPPVYFGTSGDVLLAHITDEGFTLVLISVMMLCAIAVMGVSIYLALNHILDNRFLDVTIFLIQCGLWCFCDSGLARYISHMSAGVEGISFYCFMTLGIPFARLVANTGSIRKHASVHIVTGSFFVNVVVQTILWALGVADFIEMLPVTHVLLAAGILVCVVQMYREYRQTRGRQLAILLAAFGIVGFSGTLALVLYWMFAISFYGVIFELGILGFIILLMGYLCVELVDSLRYKAELQVYERLSREDSMTGLQNRRSFDEYLQTLVEALEEDTDAELLFLDMNDLKEVNDRYGHKAGDELIIGAAQCLKEAFGAQAVCFRLGGDEFCVVIPLPKGEKADWRNNLEKTLERYNRSHRVRISLAVGSSMLLDENGYPKSLSDWKQEADLQMYEGKKKMKQRMQGAGGKEYGV